MAQTSADAGAPPDELFNGFDSISAGILNQSAVTGGSEQSGTGTGARAVVRIKVCESQSELADALEIDGSLSVSYLKAANVTAKMKFMKKLNVTAQSVSIVIYALHESGTWKAKNAGVAQGIALPSADDDKATNDFVDLYGDSYVSAVTLGGEFFAVYTFRTETRTEQKELTAELKAKGIYTGMTAEIGVQAKLTQFLSTTTTAWTFEQEMTGIANPKFPSKEELIKFALEFTSLPLTAPDITNFKVSGYETVPKIGRANFRKVIGNRDYFLGRNGVLRTYARLDAALSTALWLKKIYARYGYAGDTGLTPFATAVSKDIDTVERQITAYLDSPTTALAMPKLDSLKDGEPVLDFTAHQPESFGGEGGGFFPFMPIGDALRNQVKVASLQFATDDQGIRRIQIGYDSIGFDSSGRKWKEIWGADGSWREPVHFDVGQWPIRFNIRCDDKYIYKVGVITSYGTESWAGVEKGSLRSWSVPDGAVLVGFSGRYGLMVDQLKMMYATLHKPRFVQPTR